MTIKNRILSAIAIFVFNFSIAQAQTFDKPTAYVGLNYYYYYEKYNGHDPLMELKSQLPTVLIGYRDEAAIRSNNKSIAPLSWNAEASYGRVNYSQYTGTGAHTHDYWTVQAEGLYALPNNFYLGLGYRYLYDYLGDAGPGGYDRKQEYLYLPVGYILNNPDSSFKLQYNHLIMGQNHSDASNNGSQPAISPKNNKGWGLDLSYLPSKNSKWEIFGKYWNIADSKVDKGYLEPQNYTYEIGVKYAF
jgi:hypothetical protein